MKDTDKQIALIRLRDIIYSGVRPTVRQCGFSQEIIQELIKEQLIRAGDVQSAADAGSVVIEEILPAGHTFILHQHAVNAQNKLSPVLP